MKPGTPILTPWFHERRYGARCAFCAAWFELLEEHLDQLVRCPSCGQTLKLNPFVVRSRWRASISDQAVLTEARPDGSREHEALAQFADFVRRRAHIFSTRPAQVFQQAANEPDALAPAAAARQAWRDASRTRPWAEWINKPQARDPRLITVPGTHGCAFSPDGRRLVSPCPDHSLKVWDAASGECLLIMSGHTGEVRACVYSPDGRSIASASDDGTSRVWDAITGEMLATLVASSDGVMDCDFSPDGGRLVSGTTAGTITVWDIEEIENPRARFTLNGKYGVWKCSYSPDGRYIVSAHVEKSLDYIRYADQAECQLKFWVADAGIEFDAVGYPYNMRTAAAFLPDATRVLIGIRQIQIFSLQETNDAPLDSTHDQSLPSAEVSSAYEDAASVAVCCAFAPDASQVAVADSHGGLMVWDCRSGQRLHTFSAGASPISECVYSPDGRHIATASSQGVTVWEAPQPARATAG